MNNNIQEAYVTFENAKLLKEKGFDIAIREFWAGNPGVTICEFVEPSSLSTGMDKNYVLAPTTALAIAWIRENFGIHIYSQPILDKTANPERIRFMPSTYEYEIEMEAIKDTNEESENFVIEYTLKHLI